MMAARVGYEGEDEAWGAAAAGAEGTSEVERATDADDA
jgi:hypothetical protein